MGLANFKAYSKLAGPETRWTRARYRLYLGIRSRSLYGKGRLRMIPIQGDRVFTGIQALHIQCDLQIPAPYLARLPGQIVLRER